MKTYLLLVSVLVCNSYCHVIEDENCRSGSTIAKDILFYRHTSPWRPWDNNEHCTFTLIPTHPTNQLIIKKRYVSSGRNTKITMPDGTAVKEDFLSGLKDWCMVYNNTYYSGLDNCQMTETCSRSVKMNNKNWVVKTDTDDLRLLLSFHFSNCTMKTTAVTATYEGKTTATTDTQPTTETLLSTTNLNSNSQHATPANREQLLMWVSIALGISLLLCMILLALSCWKLKMATSGSQIEQQKQTDSNPDGYKGMVDNIIYDTSRN
uniref:uncharacterized protein LOC101243062 isoform X2 n=1 Tax=Ciona intestinalis TaxID=7719 RepID=UPI0005212806|nr:uncharacterized protein LOC101243062 isoform X2 [Ciona intestinalis]|eukprot:XP_009861599.1 uncharacterized protein LOC101243062 isoform X2 [Ciona intestinalis]